MFPFECFYNLYIKPTNVLKNFAPPNLIVAIYIKKSMNTWIFLEELKVVTREMISTASKYPLKPEKWFLLNSDYVFSFSLICLFLLQLKNTSKFWTGRGLIFNFV